MVKFIQISALVDVNVKTSTIKLHLPMILIHLQLLLAVVSYLYMQFNSSGED